MGCLSYFLIAILVVGCAYLWPKSHKFRYYMKLLYYNTIMVIVSGFLVIPPSLFRPRDVRNLRPVSLLYKCLFCVFGIDLELRNEKYLKSDKPYVLVANHQSSLDVIPLMTFLPDRCTILAKKELLYAGLFGMGAWLCGLVFVDRLNKDHARNTMERVASELHEKNIKLWIFPEGTRNSGGKMLPFKKGAFHLALQAKVPIVPLVISTYKAFYDKKNKIFEKGKMIVEALPPIEYSDSLDAGDLAVKVREQMVDKFEEISKETLSAYPPLQSRI